MHYLIKRQDRYYFNRRVPLQFRSFDSRDYVRVALKTDSRTEAQKLAIIQNESLEEYWKGLLRNGETHQSSSYEKTVHRARLLGFSYKTSNALAQGSLTEILTRLTKLEGNPGKQKVEALLGGVEPPTIRLSDLLKHYMSNAKGKMLNKSENQVRKWLNPRKLAMRNLQNSIGNKEIRHLTRDDLLKHRDWWIAKIEKGQVIAGTANKNLIAVKCIIEDVNETLRLGLDTSHIFKNIKLQDENPGKRLPLDSDFIRNVLLNPENLKGLNEQARWALHAMAETGAGVSEQVGLMPEDIVLSHDIPHIIITPRQKKALKTKYRRRIIPLVGHALDAFRACPEGFKDYCENPDILSNILSKYLRENDLLPSENHSVYSLRHSFQDRLLAVNAPDRVQADLMGHKFNRPSYGDGASLAQKLEWMQKVQLSNA